MSDHEQEQVELLQRLYGEVGRIRWRALQRFFAQGVVLKVRSGRDLVKVAAIFVNDSKEKLKKLMESSEVVVPGDEQARDWFHDDVEVWSIVVAPFVLVQELNDKEQIEQGETQNGA